MDLCRQSKYLLFNMLFRLVIVFLSRSKCLLISWLQSPPEVIFVEPMYFTIYAITVMWCMKYVWFLLVTKPHRYWNYCGLLPISIFEGNTKFWLEISEFNWVAQSCPTLQPHEPQHARPPCLSPTLRVHPNSYPLSRWCHPTISSSVIPFSCPQSFPASGSFQMSQLFASSGQSIGASASASVLPMNI